MWNNMSWSHENKSYNNSIIHKIGFAIKKHITERSSYPRWGMVVEASCLWMLFLSQKWGFYQGQGNYEYLQIPAFLGSVFVNGLDTAQMWIQLKIWGRLYTENAFQIWRL